MQVLSGRNEKKTIRMHFFGANEENFDGDYEALPRINPKRIGDGMKAKRLIIVSPKPMATVLSFSSTHLTETRKLEARPVAPLNLRRQTTAKKT